MAGGFRIADWNVEPQLNSLEREGHTLRLEPKVMQVLACLADRQGELVTKDQLIRAVWPDTFVTDDVLTRCISELRKALNDDPRQPCFVETIPKGGYRLIPPVRQLAPATQTKAPRRQRRFLFLCLGLGLVTLVAVLLFAVSERRPSWFSSSGRAQPPKIASSPRSIAVLPMENLSEDASQEYFADGVTDELITNLAKIASLRVISRTSVMQYKRAHQPLPDIARALHVELILTGSVVRAGDRVRITAQLVDGNTDSHLWAQEFERDLQNVLTLESEMAHEIAREIRVQLTKEDGDRLQPSQVVSPQAHDAYLRGRYLWSKKNSQSLQESITFFHQAIAYDPDYAPAYAGIADSYIVMENSGYLAPTDANPLIKANALKAVELDANLADAHMVLAASEELDWNWAGAEQEYRRAIDLNPGLARAHHWYSLLLSNLNRPAEAIAEIQRAVDLDPLSDALYRVEAVTYYQARQYDRAEQIPQAFQGTGKDSIFARYMLGRICLARKDYSAAMSDFLIASRAQPDALALLVYAYAQAGDKSRAQTTLAKLKKIGEREYVSPYWMALAWTGLDDHDKAIVFLNDAYRIRSSNLSSLLVDPMFDPLRSDPRFQELLRKMAFPVALASASAHD